MYITITIMHCVLIYVMLVLSRYVALYSLYTLHVMSVRLCSKAFPFWNKNNCILSQKYFFFFWESEPCPEIWITLMELCMATLELIFSFRFSIIGRKNWYSSSHQFPSHGINNGIMISLLVLLTSVGIFRWN